MCVFCKIANHKQQEEDIIYEDNDVFVVPSICPVAEIHLLIIPKEHIGSVTDLSEQNINLMGHMILIAKKMAEEKDLNKKGYKLAINVGHGGGQVVDHLHLHLLGGGGLK
ncbi:MAG: HIT domain-containing protein [bacterium]